MKFLVDIHKKIIFNYLVEQLIFYLATLFIIEVCLFYICIIMHTLSGGHRKMQHKQFNMTRNNNRSSKPSRHTFHRERELGMERKKLK